MAVRSMLARVHRLEQSALPCSPFVRAWGSFDAFVADCENEIAVGALDYRDFPFVLKCLQRWEGDGTWG